MMKKITYICFLACCCFATAQQSSLSELLERYNTKNIPYISVQELAMPKTVAVILDAREQSEYEISHIKDAIHIGYSEFDIDRLQSIVPDKDTHLVVYCTLGIRSETIAHKLKLSGYSKVSNLYGGIVEWMNQGYKLYNMEQNQTESVHVFSKHWGKWLQNGIPVHD